jgi:hypothetical protein
MWQEMRKLMTVPGIYIKSRTSEEKMVAWRQPTTIFLVNQHAQAYARYHNVAGVKVTPPVMQLLPWGN